MFFIAKVIYCLNFKQILKIVADKSGLNDNWVTRQQILDDFSLKKTSLDSAIRTLKDKMILIKNPNLIYPNQVLMIP